MATPRSKGRKSKSAPVTNKPTAEKQASGARMAIDLDQLKELMQTIEHHGITELEIEKGGERIVLRRGVVAAHAPVAPVVTAHAPSPTPIATVHTHAAAPATQAEDDPNVVFVTSPFVGTFYRAASPTSEPFVKDGQEIQAGQVLCIVEAMKLMNEIEAEFAGTVVACLAENGKPVEYGDRLFKVRKR